MVEPGRAITPMLATALRAWKPELIRTLARATRPVTADELAPCAACASEFVIRPEQCCPWCDAAMRQGRFLLTPAARVSQTAVGLATKA